MELKRLRLENFRQFAETEIELGPSSPAIVIEMRASSDQ